MVANSCFCSKMAERQRYMSMFACQALAHRHNAGTPAALHSVLAHLLYIVQMSMLGLFSCFILRVS